MAKVEGTKLRRRRIVTELREIARVLAPVAANGAWVETIEEAADELARETT